MMRRPSTIRWDGPEGFGVEINEEGVHLTKGGHLVLDPCDLTELLGVITLLIPDRDWRAVAELRDARRSLADQIEQIQGRAF
ncbi:hypothetical protein ACTQ40_09925 [Collinsella sp. Sow4_D11]|uniref:hypothetical protein n=1 Tax=Collinsella sp. Sow4_D11 TaxID=3438775 RepID=UPI003F8EBF89